MSVISNQSYWKYFKSLQFREKCLMFLYFIALVPCSLKLLMGINARIGLSMINPMLDTVVLVLFSILSFPVCIRNLKIWNVLLVFVYGWFVFWSPNIYPETYFAVLAFGPYLVLNCLPYYLVGASINVVRYEVMFECIGRWGLIVNIFICGLAIMGFAQKLFGDENNMELAYGVLPSVVFVTRNMMRYGKREDVYLTIVGTFLILSLGSRGALLAFVLYCAGELVFFREYKKPFITRVWIFLATMIFYLLSKPILLMMESLTSLLGFGTRVYSKLLSGEIVNTESRDWIFNIVSEYITSDNGKIGYGLFYDRVLMGMTDSSYAHNIIYEVLLNFGIYIGTFLIVVFVLMFIANIFKTRKTSISSLLFAFFCSCIVCLFFSSSYLRSSNFWLFLGLMITTLGKSRKTLNLEN